MAKVRGTSTAPIVLGIIGGVLGLPASVCSGACAAGFSSLVEESEAVIQTTGSTFMAIGIIASLIAILFACFAKKAPILAGVMLLVSTVLSCITLITFNVLTLIAIILTLIAGILCFTQKKEIIE